MGGYPVCAPYALLTAGMVLVGGGMALAGWFNGRSGRLRALCIACASVAYSRYWSGDTGCRDLRDGSAINPQA